jgi:cytochrome d ubiquinol oxidase subunit I
MEHDTKVTGLDSVPPDDRPPANTMLHWAFDTMVGICTALIALGPLARHRLVAQAGHPTDAVVPAGGGAVWGGDDRRARVRMDRDRSGPPAVDRLQRDADQGCGYRRERHLDHARAVVLLYAALGIATVVILRTMARRWREAEVPDTDVPYGPRPSAPEGVEAS